MSEIQSLKDQLKRVEEEHEQLRPKTAPFERLSFK